MNTSDLRTKRNLILATVMILLGTAIVLLRVNGIVTRAENAPADHDAPLANETWSGGDINDGEWQSGGNWAGVGGAGPDDDLFFPDSAERKTNHNGFAVNTSFNTLNFTGGPYVISGNQIVLANGITANSSSVNTFGPNILLGANQTWTNSNGGDVQLEGVVNLNNHTLTLNTTSGSAAFRFDSLINGTGTITKNGAGELTIKGNAGGFGTTISQAGTIRILTGGTLGAVNFNGGKLLGDGTVGQISGGCSSGSCTVQPGNGSTVAGVLTSSGNVSLSLPQYTLAVNLNGTTAGAEYSRLVATGGDINLANCNLSVFLGFVPHPGDVFTIVNTVGAGNTIIGQFAQGNRSRVDGHAFKITYNSISVSLTALPPTAFDFDGDQMTDISVFRPGPGEWYLNRSTQGFFGATFGQSTDKVAAADFTGDGLTDIALFRPSNGNWFVLRSENSTFFAFPFGQNGDIPAAADFDADGKADATVYRPSVATWFTLRSSNGAVTSTQFGNSTDQPVPSDYDGDGKADIAIWRPGPGEWWILKSSSGQAVGAQFGQSTDKPTPGDFTGDGKADRAFFRPSTGNWFILRSEDSSFFAFPFGQNGDKPVPGDYDGDGKFDAAVFRPTGSNWFISKSSGGTQIQAFGLPTDIPIPGAAIP